jgi:hypothetical protein
MRSGPDKIARRGLRAEETLSHLVILLLAVLITLAAGTLRVSEQSRVEIPGLGLPLPDVCAYQQLVGHDCPGCGLTRSFVCVAHGDLPRAWSYHVTGPVLFALVVFQIPYRALQLWRLTRGRAAMRLCGELWIVWPLLIALLTQWAVRAWLGRAV